MSSLSKLAFKLAPAPAMQEYRQFWQQNLKETQARLADLERPRTISELGSYLEELNELHLLGNLSDARGEIWRDMHPDSVMREEAQEADKAFVDLYSEVFSSSGVASNLSNLEAEGSIAEADSKRFVKIWKEDLRLGGAYLSDASKAEVKRLSREIAECTNEFEDNIRNDPIRLELSAEELVGLPDDYPKNRTINPSTQKVTISTKAADISPIQDYCQIQATRENVSLCLQRSRSCERGRLEATSSSPSPEGDHPGILKLCGIRSAGYHGQNPCRGCQIPGRGTRCDQASSGKGEVRNRRVVKAEGRHRRATLGYSLRASVVEEPSLVRIQSEDRTSVFPSRKSVPGSAANRSAAVQPPIRSH